MDEFRQIILREWNISEAQEAPGDVYNELTVTLFRRPDGSLFFWRTDQQLRRFDESLSKEERAQIERCWPASERFFDFELNYQQAYVTRQDVQDMIDGQTQTILGSIQEMVRQLTTPDLEKIKGSVQARAKPTSSKENDTCFAGLTHPAGETAASSRSAGRPKSVPKIVRNEVIPKQNQLRFTSTPVTTSATKTVDRDDLMSMNINLGTFVEQSNQRNHGRWDLEAEDPSDSDSESKQTLGAKGSFEKGSRDGNALLKTGFAGDGRFESESQNYRDRIEASRIGKTKGQTAKVFYASDCHNAQGRQICRSCGMEGHCKDACPHPGKRLCYYCKKIGSHVASECRKRQADLESPQGGSANPQPSKRGRWNSPRGNSSNSFRGNGSGTFRGRGKPNPNSLRGTRGSSSNRSRGRGRGGAGFQQRPGGNNNTSSGSSLQVIVENYGDSPEEGDQPGSWLNEESWD
ncbi:uncharacterized protein LOC100114711 isoform X2 [Nasonia vitripennis]|nr:uncharacterized protein LOC100114711 isoform X2 [Nasonia vitripennis]XP_031780132.1 uncharacterized protein LOC100114711 isoform X2 [Nasonia vitripennis]XP_031780149.1 uncharacterized protein LOC100114711 isoform X2 [Nasonia vitripennis]XP_031780187.1 uncharacterized protein LOC100114711 isoform X2 [Nasonia vitripennis]XP_031780230.1 uncharacterized protein LOC100114711 isoform X2 [Nasonia vitripennis]XP_031780260.1 uncharacterized protein LOC100114711 isoform X2 [Nasonia vitripennis]XP_03